MGGQPDCWDRRTADMLLSQDYHKDGRDQASSLVM
jgi:hypothetical protein